MSLVTLIHVLQTAGLMLGSSSKSIPVDCELLLEVLLDQNRLKITSDRELLVACGLFQSK